MQKYGTLLIILLMLAACNTGGTAATPTEAAPPATTAAEATTVPEASATTAPTEIPVEPTATAAATNTAAPLPPTLTPAPTDEPAEPSGVTPTPAVDTSAIPDAAIVISMPASGSLVAAPLTVTGVASPTFEQNLIIRVISADGEVIVQQPTTIQADMGQRGAYEATLDFDVDTRTPAFIQVFTDSPMDGAVVSLSSVGVQLLPPGEEGEQNIIQNEDTLEHIYITSPTAGESLSGGVVRVEGIGRAGFENTLVAELRDANGTLLANLAITLEAPLGGYGPFTIELPYTISGATPARLTVRDVSPAHGGDAFLSSIHLQLAP